MNNYFFHENSTYFFLGAIDGLDILDLEFFFGSEDFCRALFSSRYESCIFLK